MKQRNAQAVPSSAPEPKPTALGPKENGPSGKRMKLVIIDCDPEMVRLGRNLLGETCDIPSIARVSSLEEAKKIVDEQKPDVVIMGKRIDDRQDAWRDLLAHIRSKGQVPGAKVVLWSNGLTGGENMERARYRFDAVVHSTDIEELVGLVEFYRGAGRVWGEIRSLTESAQEPNH